MTIALRLPDLGATTAITDAALVWGRAGWRVFPCDPATKRPIGNMKWSLQAATDPEKIRRLFTRPDAMIGCALPRGVIVIDVDHKPAQGFVAEKSIAALIERFPELAAAPRVLTPSGGAHFWLSCDPRENLVQRPLVPGVDVRIGGKGYVIVPPSRRSSGASYIIVRGVRNA